MALGDAILRAVGQLPKLRSLIVGQIASATMDFSALSKASALETLALGPIVATDRGLPGLENLTRLKNLALDGQGLTDEAVRDGRPYSLESLTLNDGKVTGSGFSALDTLAAFHFAEYHELSDRRSRLPVASIASPLGIPGSPRARRLLTVPWCRLPNSS